MQGRGLGGWEWLQYQVYAQWRWNHERAAVLMVVLARSQSNIYRIVTARDMTASERKRFQRRFKLHGKAKGSVLFFAAR